MKAVKREKFTGKSVTRRTDLDPARNAIAVAKTRVLIEYGEQAGENVRLLRLALNEAEALAWQTSFPQLFFHELAAEKAEATIRWHQQQRAVRRKALEVAFAE